MSIKTKLSEVHECDSCGKDCEHYPSKCDVCGKEFCWGCREGNVKTFDHGVYCSGSGDGSYCNECAKKALEAKEPRMMAFLTIRDLRVEAIARNDEFSKRVKEAEAIVKSLSIPRR